MIMLVRDEKSGIKSGNIMKNENSCAHLPTIKTSQTSVKKEYFKYFFLRIRTITEFHTEKGFCIS